MVFYMGTHMPHWLSQVDVPLFVSRRTLSRVKKPKRATCSWMLDSGGFSELSMFGEWRTREDVFIEEVCGWSEKIGRLQAVAIQDWMCEPLILAKTGKTLVEHQRLTVESYLSLRAKAGEVPWFPILQGWELGDYERHRREYERNGVRLDQCPVVGVGSVCRRQGTDEIGAIFRELAMPNLHGFGVKIKGIAKYGSSLQSCDSLAWSFDARRKPPIDGHTHKNCANCLEFALAWRTRVLTTLAETPV